MLRYEKDNVKYLYFLVNICKIYFLIKTNNSALYV